MIHCSSLIPEQGPAPAHDGEKVPSRILTLIHFLSLSLLCSFHSSKTSILPSLTHLVCTILNRYTALTQRFEFFPTSLRLNFYLSGLLSFPPLIPQLALKPNDALSLSPTHLTPQTSFSRLQGEPPTQCFSTHAIVSSLTSRFMASEGPKKSERIRFLLFSTSTSRFRICSAAGHPRVLTWRGTQ